MNYLLIVGGGALCLAMLLGAWLGWQLLRQNGRMLPRLEELEKRVDELEFGEPDSEKSEMDESLVTSAVTNGEERANRFTNRSLARSRIKRDGLKAGTAAPSFRLPRLDGRELSLEELRGKRLLLVFSDPHCGPCNALAPQLERIHRDNGRKKHSPSPQPSPTGEGEPSPGVEVVMISRGDPKENRAKVKEHGLTFPVLLQAHWEISRLYAIFATPIAYLIDEIGCIASDVAVGMEPILALASAAAHSADLKTDSTNQSNKTKKTKGKS